MCASGIRQLSMKERNVRSHSGICKVTSPGLSDHSGKRNEADSSLPHARTHAHDRHDVAASRRVRAADTVEMQRDCGRSSVKETTRDIGGIQFEGKL